MQKIINKLKQLTRHRNAKLVSCGNAAIFAALYMVREANSSRNIILVPDQGGWLSFRTYPEILGFKIKEIKTDKGIIDLKVLEANSKKAAALLVTSFAGYFAEQPMEEISKICRKNKCLLVEDASGAIGDKTLCNGSQSDIIVSSFGKGKIVDLGTGGFISADSKEYFEMTKDIYSMMEFNADKSTLLNKLENAKKRVDSFMKKCEEIKKDLEKENLEVFHKEKRGINVVVGFKNSKEKEKIIKYCNNNRYEFVICPKEIRVNEDAISIEVKRL